MSASTRQMTTLVLLNSASPAFREAVERVLPYVEHLGMPCVVHDLNTAPLPVNLREVALILITHPALDPLGNRLGKAGRQALLTAIRDGIGLVSFDPCLPSPCIPDPPVDPVHAHTVDVSPYPHFILDNHVPQQTIHLAGELLLAPMAVDTDDVLLFASGKPLLAASQAGKGRLVRWAATDWMLASVLGAVGGLDDVFWRSLVWAARKPFALRGMAPLITMRVDDVLGRGELWAQTPLAWAQTASRFGFKPWLGLFIYNLSPSAINECRDLLLRGRATAAPHAFGHLPKPGRSAVYYFDQGMPPNPGLDEEFIFYNHIDRAPWSDQEADRRLAAVDEWYQAHAPLPMSRILLPHWYECGSNTLAHVQDRWQMQFSGKVMDMDIPYQAATPWLKSGPFRQHEKPRPCDSARPTAYADFVNFGGRQFFNCVTEIRDDAGYEWAPDGDIHATAERGLRQLRRALHSFVLPVLFSHETDYLHKIPPDAWEKELRLIAAGLQDEEPIFVTLDDGMRYVRATRTSQLKTCWSDVSTGVVVATFSGHADSSTHFHLFTQGEEEIKSTLVEVPPFDGQVVVTSKG